MYGKGGSTQADPNVRINADGSAEFAGQINTPKVSIVDGTDAGLLQIFGGNPLNKDLVLNVYNGSNRPIQMYGDGSAEFAGNVDAGSGRGHGDVERTLHGTG